MKIKVEGADMSVILTIEQSFSENENKSWTASPEGIIGADRGHWTRTEMRDGGDPILFYGTEPNDKILMFDAVTRSSNGSPFKRWQTGTGRHLSAGGTLPTLAAVEWKILSK